jgi:uncharacterized protein YuzE
VTKWTYDEEVDCAYIQVDEREPNGVRTVELTGVHVILDVDLDGKVLGLELLPGFGGTVKRIGLARYLKEEPNGRERKVE